MAIKDDIVSFLKTDAAIQRINFKMDGFLVYPQAYAVDIAGLVARDLIRVKTTTSLDDDVYASYFVDYNQFWIRPGFSTTSDDDCSALVHEATHAHMDYKALGMKPIEWSEAIAYLAEAFYREARRLKPLTDHFIRAKAHSLAKRMLASGQYEVPADVARSMIMAAKAEPHYVKKARGSSTSFAQPFVNFDGF
ncbi:DUF4419 domain-containing protein [Roseomonas sp. CECT 9278]|uniref:DUF4419 domain-containing protein n=1 Tax=Roseomonas sp. CECT 9278 TaxID=2845823 RepID=UPI001E3A8083|nr:DUF4419 domain-containing protein [Roseomonas sp. CECT 9278]CAH0266713.1 hypothetical protein ROS9278_03544 [Roseomonas sp. CECT 9278]